MTLVASGQISIDDIRTEIGTTDGSLRALSSLAGMGTPDSLSEFYNYNAFTYYATWGADDPCNYDYWDIYYRSNGLYYRDTGFGYDLIGYYATYWYEFLYYEPLFDGNVYQQYNISGNVPTATGTVFSSC